MSDLYSSESGPAEPKKDAHCVVPIVSTVAVAVAVAVVTLLGTTGAITT